MDEQERKYFDDLISNRLFIASALDQPAARGVRTSVVEKYSDQAHFIYELLQNADDAFATNARFILKKGCLIFAHDGKRHFSISDPSKEDFDEDNGNLGDINAITSIGNSNKTEASIGKFGVGFKAVFQYTSTPHIYDERFKFRIDRFIVPSLLNDDHPERMKNETLFLFPFDHPDRNATEAYKDISAKLNNLSFPLLFLSNLKNIEFSFDNTIGLYGKEILKRIKFDNTVAEKIELTHNDGDTFITDSLWMFSRVDDAGRQYSVCYFLDNKGALKSIIEPAFCFFPTKETTGLNFLIHAPFLLTDSREGIRAGIEHNETMIQKLAKLSADSMVYLKEIGKEEGKRLLDDTILNIIPFNPADFSDPKDKRKVSFYPFYEEIKNIFLSSEIIPTRDGYTTQRNAYWADVIQLTELFSNEQLSQICGNEKAEWAFVTINRNEAQRGQYTNNKIRALLNYVDSLTRTSLNEDVILNGRSRVVHFSKYKDERATPEYVKGIDEKFIETQSIEWLHQFYEWLSETKHRIEIAKTKPVFIDQNYMACSVYDKEGQLITFLPLRENGGYRTINDTLLQNEKTKAFLEQIGIKEPSIRDQIYNIILPQYETETEIDTDPHFQIFFKYYCECQDEEDDYIELIKNCKFLKYYDQEDDTTYRDAASTMYLPTPELISFLETKPSTKFVALDEYKQLIDTKYEKKLISFLKDLGVHDEIQIFEKEIDYLSRENLPKRYSTREESWTETYIDGCEEIVDYIVEHEDVSKSVILWDCLLSIIKDQCDIWNYDDLDDLLVGTYKYFYYSPQRIQFESYDSIRLKTSKWLVNKQDEFVSPDNVTLDELSESYDISSRYGQHLIEFLGISEETIESDDNLTDSQREKIDLANEVTAILEAHGLEVSELSNVIAAYKKSKEYNQIKNVSKENDSLSSLDNDLESEESYFDNVVEDVINNTVEREDDHGNEKKIKVIKEILRRTKYNDTSEELEQISMDEDSDEYMPSTIDYAKMIDRAEQKNANELNRIIKCKELQEKAVTSPKYSFGWFKALLEMECLSSNVNNMSNREVSISFAKVEREPGTKRTLVLQHPNRYIPAFMEDLSDIPLVLHYDDSTKTLPIEVANIRSYTLRVKLKNNVNINNIDFSAVRSATIDAKSPVFLLEELKKKLNALDIDDSYNLQNNLTENIEFVFGPPGTGKTTYLAKKVILPLMSGENDYKVLVLTPTNKAADVLVNRIIDASNDDTYNRWLVRFGTTGDESIEDSPVYKDKTFDLRNEPKSVTVTTIARFPYDYFMPAGDRLYLDAINWDYIIIDEASMIPLVNVVYPLFKKTPYKFVIAGDPFQIEPITSVDLWKNENIYTMVRLKSFVNPETIPHQYKVQLLTTQYRSVPAIGDVFSRFAYGGVLKHYRSAQTQRKLNLNIGFDIKTLNILKYPVSNYESIYKSKRLKQSSSFHIYAALFTFEYIEFLGKELAKNNPNESYKIGIIAPYRAQADIIDKLLTSSQLPKSIDVQVGTIHGFQGDECDIIFAVLNTPPSLSTSKEMFLNKLNIINVSISRAKDYLFLVMPDDDTDNIDNLKLVKRVESLMKTSSSWIEYKTADLEKVLFNESNYIENNSFSTSHHSVNVYGFPEQKYEIRVDKDAVDIQIHDTVSTFVSESKTKNLDQLEVDNSVITEEISYQVSQKTPNIKLGDRVMHTSYGKGRIISITKKYIIIQYKNRSEKYDFPNAFDDGVLKIINRHENITPFEDHKNMYNKEPTSSAKEYAKVGDKVKHGYYGTGVVRSIANDKISVRFQSGVQEFKYPIIMTNGSLQLCSDEKENNSKREIVQSKFKVGDQFKHPVLGLCEIKSSNLNYFEVKFLKSNTVKWYSKRELDDLLKHKVSSSSQGKALKKTASIGDSIVHDSYGIGIIKEVLEQYVIVQFSGFEKKFKYPEAFERGFLKYLEEPNN